jgi:anti-sigma B factor antagonist
MPDASGARARPRDLPEEHVSPPAAHPAGVVRVTRLSGRTVIGLAGDFDIAAAAALLGGVADATADRLLAVLVLDLGDVTFLDCSGLSCLRAAKAIMSARQGLFVLRRVPPSVSRLLATVGLGLDLAPVLPVLDRACATRASGTSLRHRSLRTPRHPAGTYDHPADA